MVKLQAFTHFTTNDITLWIISQDGRYNNMKYTECDIKSRWYPQRQGNHGICNENYEQH